MGEGRRRRREGLPRRRRRPRPPVLVYGAVTLQTERLRPTFAAAALQADIDQNVPWSGARPADPAYTRRVMDAYAAQAREAAAQGARLVVWPETAFPGYLRTDF